MSLIITLRDGSVLRRPVIRKQKPARRDLYGTETSGNYGHAGRIGEVGGSAPGGAPQTPAFKKWFGKSKVVTEDGAPLRLYHATKQNFDQFATAKSPSRDVFEPEMGAHFGTQEQVDSFDSVKGSNVMPVYLSIENPVRLKDFGDFHASAVAVQLVKQGVLSAEEVDPGVAGLWAREELRGKKSRHDPMSETARNSDLSIEEQTEYLQKALQSKGYDGIVYLNRREGYGESADTWADAMYSRDISDEQWLKDHPEGRDSWIAFKPEQIKSATGNRGTFDPNDPKITMSDWFDLYGTAESGNHGHAGRPGEVGGSAPGEATDTPEFKTWFNESQVVDDDGDPLRVYHGTTHDIESFKEAGAEGLNPESDWGAGIYFTNDPDDAGENYAGEGPDLTNRIEQRAEAIINERDGDYDALIEDARKEARAELVGKSGAVTMPVYLSIQKPFVVGDGRNKETVLEFEWPDATEDDPYEGEQTGPLMKFYDAVNEARGDFNDTEGIDGFLENVMTAGFDGGVTASQLQKMWSDSEIYATNDHGDLVGKEIFRRALAGAGFDGVIDQSVNTKFGSDRKFGQKMKGMDADTAHYIVFKPTQVKSAIGNKGTFDPTNPKITMSYREKMLLLVGNEHSGNHGHAGRPGEVGGSAPSDGSDSSGDSSGVVRGGGGSAPSNGVLPTSGSIAMEGGGPEREKWEALNSEVMAANDEYLDTRDTFRATMEGLYKKYGLDPKQSALDNEDLYAEYKVAKAPLDAANEKLGALERALEAQGPAMRKEVVTNVATKVAERLGIDPSIIHVVDEPAKEFTVGDKHFTEGGHFDPYSGQIELNSRNISYGSADAVKGIAAHEISHAIYNKLQTAAKIEHEAYLAKALDGNEYSAWHNERFEDKPGSSFKMLKPAYLEEFRKAYPASAVLSQLSEREMFFGISESMIKENGHSPYAKAYWEKEAIRNNGFSYESAINETIAEITRYLAYPSSWSADSDEPKDTSPWVQFTKDMHTWYKGRRR